ncbi:MAG: hypothetical protein R6V02_07890 [Candidatus Aminicenantes bacterium]
MDLLRLLDIIPSPECRDFLKNKKQFHLHSLPTEQLHPLTLNLSETVREDTLSGLRMLLDVDADIALRLEEWARRPVLLEKAADMVKSTLLSGRKIYIYGCGATGRLAKQMESTFWRPFWSRVQSDINVREKIRNWPGGNPGDRLIGEMTGGDRALISSLEGFEDLALTGRLQLQDHSITTGDAVFCVTEGGETSSVIGAILAARDLWKKKNPNYGRDSHRFLYFIYNNPDSALRPLARSREVLDEPGISKINLATGPQALAGSTRMQAATIDTFVVGHVLQTGAERALREYLSDGEMRRLGFLRETPLAERLTHFRKLLAGVKQAAPDLARLTEREAETYLTGRKSTYFASEALITVFIDSTERSPTFRLYPLDTTRRNIRRCWIQVWTSASSREKAWAAFLGRPFRGLRPDFFRKPFEENISDPYLKKAALSSLRQAGESQKNLYDFSLSRFNLEKRKPAPGDTGLAVAAEAERPLLGRPGSGFRRFFHILEKSGIPKNLLAAAESPLEKWEQSLHAFPEWEEGRDIAVLVPVDARSDPMGISRHCALKMILNAHSTAVMARLGKITGNSMVHVHPSNLKLTGRAVHLIQFHVNNILSGPWWTKRRGKTPPVTYPAAAAVLFEAVIFLKNRSSPGQPAEVPLSIIRILEALRRSEPVTQNAALNILKQQGLRSYLKDVSA